MQTTFTLRTIIIASLSMASLFTPTSRVTAQAVSRIGTGIKDGTPTPVRRAAQLVQTISTRKATTKAVQLPLHWQVEEWDGKPHVLEFHFYHVRKGSNGKKVIVPADNYFEAIPNQPVNNAIPFGVTITTKPGSEPGVPKGLYLLAGVYTDDEDGPFEQKGAGFTLFQVGPPPP